LSYEIIGACFDVYNEIGGKHKERFLEKAVAASFKDRGLAFKEQIPFQLKFKEVIVGKYIFDFVVKDLIAVELKSSGRFRKQDFEQIKRYLNNSSLPLGLLIRFSDEGVTFQRILNQKTIS
jgi:GxxExxY protein